MPGGDRTGPMGAGPMTGRGAGYCRGSNMPGYANPGFGGGGFGRGRGGGFGGGGRGWRNRYYATGVPGWAANQGFAPGQAPSAAGNFATRENSQNELTFLKEQAEYFKAALEDINKRLNELQSGRGE